MKKHCLIYIATLSAALLFVQLARAQSPQESGESLDLKNSLTLGFGTLNTVFNEDIGFLPVSVEFDRYFTDRFSWGANLTYSKTTHSFSSIFYELYESFFLLSGKISYSLLLTKQKSCLKFGLGFGFGYYSKIDVSVGMIPPPGYTDKATAPNRIEPHLLLDINWVIKLSRNIEVQLAPFILSPSRLMYSPFGLNEQYFNFDWFGKVAVGVRF